MTRAPRLDGDSPRDYYLALGEYQRRRTQATPDLAGSVDLALAELKVSSQNGEDGVIAEVMRRVGVRGPGYFVEFGVGSGMQANCVLLADALRWRGLFLEADHRVFGALERKYRPNARVRTRQEFVTAENIERVLREEAVPAEFDVLSLDVDGADYWIWKAVDTFCPRLVVIEYNAELDRDLSLVQAQDTGAWDRTNYFGASLGALRQLAAGKGYRLVHTESAGVNAFFVRSDLPGLWPAEPEVALRGANFALRTDGHPPDPLQRGYVTPPLTSSQLRKS